MRIVENIGRRARRRIGAVAAAAALAGAGCGPPPQVRPAANAQMPSQVTARDISLSVLGADGFKKWELDGREALASDAHATEVDVADFKLRLFAPAVPPKLDATIESPRAKIFTKQSLARSEDFLQIQGDAYQVTGWDWDWDGSAETDVIRVRRDVQVTFSPVEGGPASGRGSAAAKRPITIRSERLEIRQAVAGNQFLFAGNVSVTDGVSTTRSQQLEVLAAPEASAARGAAPPAERVVGVGRIERIIASEHVEMQQGQLSAWGQRAEFTPVDDQVALSGSPMVRDRGSDMLLQGGRILWWRERGDFEVEPRAATAREPARVFVSLPPLSSHQKDAPAPSREPGSPRLLVTGETLRAHLGADRRRVTVERSVRVEDPALTLDAPYLEVAFRSEAPAGVEPAPAGPGVDMGSLEHILARDGVVIVQPDQRTTTRQAEIFPPTGEIRLTGEPRVENFANRAVITGDEITLLTQSEQALVTGAAQRRATLDLPPLPSLTPEGVSGVAGTRVTSNTLIMDRGAETTKFLFNGDVLVSGRDLDVKCESLEALARNAPAGARGRGAANPLGTTAGVGEIISLVARRQVVIQQQDFTARAARAEIFPRAEVSPEGAAAGSARPHRFVALFGDPTGHDGPVRPTVTVPPLQDMGWETTLAGPAAADKPVGPPPTETVITSDEQELFTSPAGNQYWFKGNVVVHATGMDATCDQMQVFATSGSSPASATAPGVGASSPGGSTIQRILAEGRVRIVQGAPPDQRVATAGRAEILPARGTVLLTDNPQVSNAAGQPLARGEELLLERGRRAATVRNSTGAATGRTGRPTVVLPATSFDKPLKPRDNSPAPASRGAPPP